MRGPKRKYQKTNHHPLLPYIGGKRICIVRTSALHYNPDFQHWRVPNNRHNHIQVRTKKTEADTYQLLGMYMIQDCLGKNTHNKKRTPPLNDASTGMPQWQCGNKFTGRRHRWCHSGTSWRILFYGKTGLITSIGYKNATKTSHCESKIQYPPAMVIYHKQNK